MAQPLLATLRITLPYSINTVAHKIRGYASSAAVAGDATILERRSGVYTLPWTNQATQWANILSNGLPASTDFGAPVLEQRVGTVWNVISVAPVPTPTLAGTFAPASQFTLVLRDLAFFKLKVILLDTNVTPPYHTVSTTGSPGSLNSLVAGYLSGGLADNPYDWQKSRGDRFMAVNPFVGVTGDINDKIRRARGLT